MNRRRNSGDKFLRDFKRLSIAFWSSFQVHFRCFHSYSGVYFVEPCKTSLFGSFWFMFSCIFFALWAFLESCSSFACYFWWHAFVRFEYSFLVILTSLLSIAGVFFPRYFVSSTSQKWARGFSSGRLYAPLNLCCSRNKINLVSFFFRNVWFVLTPGRPFSRFAIARSDSCMFT